MSKANSSKSTTGGVKLFKDKAGTSFMQCNTNNILILTCLLFLIFSGVTFSVPTQVAACSVISSSGNYVLTNNIIGAPLATFLGTGCIDITADDVVLDCAGFNITNDGTSNAYAIGIDPGVQSPVSNVTIMNCPMITEYARGFFTYLAADGLITNVSVVGETVEGFHIESSSRMNITNSTASGSPDGINYMSSDDCNFSNLHLFNNSVRDIVIYHGGGTPSFFLSDVIFDSNLGDYSNYTNVSLSDTLDDLGEMYSLKGGPVSNPLPDGSTSFRNKSITFIILGLQIPSIDSITLQWTAAEAVGYTESDLEAWKDNLGAWVTLNDTSNTSTHSLSIANLATAGTIQILEVTTPLSLTVNVPTNGTYNTTTIALNYTVSNQDSCWYSLNGAANISLVDCANTTILAIEGSNTLEVYANDSQNNINTASIAFTVDTTYPTIDLTYPTEGLNLSSNVSIALNFTVSDALTGIDTTSCVYSLDGGAGVSITNCANTTFNVSDGEGQHNISINASDYAGNTVTSDLINFTIDMTAPTINLTSPANNTMRSGATFSMSFDFNYTDTFSSTANCSLILDGVSEGNNATVVNATNTEFNVTGITAGIHPWYITCTDLAGNAANSSTYYLNGTGVPSSSGSGSSSGSSSRSLSVALSSSCNNNTITTNVGTVSVNVLDENTGASVYSATTDSDGNVLFNSCGRTVRVYANKDGYRSTDNLFTLDSCSCLTPAVVPPVVIPPTPVVTPPVVTPTNTTVPTVNVTPPVVVPTTPVVPTFTGPATGRVGENTTFEVGSCPDCTVRVESPDGRTTTLTPTGGRVSLPLTLAGTYRLSLLRNGEVVSSLSVGSTAPAVAPAVPAGAGDNGMGFALIVLVLLVVVGGVAYYLMSRKK